MRNRYGSHAMGSLFTRHDQYHDPELSICEPWWFYVWAIWGTLCAGIVSWIDESLREGLVWLGMGIGIGRFGQPVWSWLTSFVIRRSSQTFDEERALDDIASGDEASVLESLTDGWLELVDPNRKPWEIYLPTVLCVGVVHGTLAGAVFGAVLPVLEDWPESAFSGAWIGLAGGPAFVCLLYAICLPIIFFWTFRGPSVDGIRSTFRLAASIAEEQDYHGIGPGHLLLAVLERPSGCVARLLEGTEFDRRQVRDFIASALPVVEISREDELSDDDSCYPAMDRAVELARELKHDEVEPGHLLLGLLEVQPALATETLAFIDLDAGEVRTTLIDCLRETRR